MRVKNVILGICGIVFFLGFCALGFYMMFYQNSSYYTIIDNSKYENIKDDDFKYKYTLSCYDEEGDEKEISFETTRELRSGAFIKLKYMITRGVVSWEEVKMEDIPSKVKAKLKLEE